MFHKRGPNTDDLLNKEAAEALASQDASRSVCLNLV